MSFEATNHVWSRRHPHSGYKVVLLCIADMLPGRDGPMGTWMVDFETIATKTDLSLRVVKTIVKQLEIDGEIEIKRGPLGTANTYRYLYKDVVGQGLKHEVRGRHLRTGKKKVEDLCAADTGGFLCTVPGDKGVVDSTVDSAVDSIRAGVVDSTVDSAVDSIRAGVVDSTRLAIVQGKKKPAQYGFALVNVEEGGSQLVSISLEERVRRLMQLKLADEQIILRCADPSVPGIIRRLRAVASG